VIEEISGLVDDLRWDGLTPAARERLTLCLLANLAVGIAGTRNCVLPEPAQGGGAYTLLSGGEAGDARAAAFWNAAAMHARTQDDFHPVGNLHIGTVVIPALMAVADEIELSGRDFLEALAAGYMVATGLSRAASPRTTPRGVRSTGLYAPFGAVAAVARARGLDRDTTGSALAMATVFAGGTTQAWIDGSDEWQLHPAHAAESGLRACELAEQGVRGGAHALDGRAGFFNALMGEPVLFSAIEADFEPSAALEESVIKRYPVSGICQAVVLAAERASRRIPDPSAIRSVVVEMNAFEITYPGTLNRGPHFRAFGDRLMSATFCTAAVLARHGLVFDDFQGAADPARDRLVSVTEVRKDDALDLLSCRTTVTLASGETVVEHVRNSREEVSIDWQTVTPWVAALFTEAGKSAADCDAAVATIRDLATATRVDLRPLVARAR
jgi:2-methylcitrate dehydratase PrpD